MTLRASASNYRRARTVIFPKPASASIRAKKSLTRSGLSICHSEATVRPGAKMSL